MKIIAVGPDIASGGIVTARYLPVASESDDRVVTMLWADERPVSWPEGCHAYLVDERRQWSTGEPAVTRLAFVRRASGLDRVQFGDHWRDVHAPLARRHHPGVVRYVQNVVVERLTPEAPDLDGIAELSFVSVDDMERRPYDSPAGREIITADVGRFIDRSAGWSMLVRPAPRPPRPPGRLPDR